MADRAFKFKWVRVRRREGGGVSVGVVEVDGVASPEFIRREDGHVSLEFIVRRCQRPPVTSAPEIKRNRGD